MAIYGAQFDLPYIAWNTAVNSGQRGDSANHTLIWVKDTNVALATNTPTEVSGVAPGLYKVTIDSTEAECLIGTLAGNSSTASVSIMPIQVPFEKVPNALPGAYGGLPTVDANNYIAGISGALNQLDDLNNFDYTSEQVTVGNSGQISQAVWEYLDRTLTSANAISGVIAQAVWEYAARILTANTNLDIQTEVENGLTAYGAGTITNQDLIYNTVNQLGLVSAAINAVAESSTVTTGTETGTYANTQAHDGTYYQVTAVGTTPTATIDFYLQFDIGSNATPVSLALNGRLDEGSLPSAGDTLPVQVYDWIALDWETVSAGWTGIASSTSSDDSVLTIVLLSKHVGSGANAGKVRVRLYSATLETNTAVYIDQAYVSHSITGSRIGYADGAIWLDTNASTSGAVPYIDGTADNPTNNLSAVNILMSTLNLNRVRVANGSFVSFGTSQTQDTYVGKNWTLDLNGQDISSNYFEGAIIIGSGAATTPPIFYGCDIGSGNHNVWLPNHRAYQCNILTRNNNATGIGSGTTIWGNCYSAVAGNETPIVSLDSTATDFNNRGWTGGLQVNNMQAGALMSHDTIAGGTLIVDSSCTGGSIRRAGWHRFADNSGGAVTISQGSGMTLNTDIYGNAITNVLQMGSHAVNSQIGNAFTYFFNEATPSKTMEDVGAVASGTLSNDDITNIWAYATRTLTSDPYGSYNSGLLDNSLTAADVWSYATRTLTGDIYGVYISGVVDGLSTFDASTDKVYLADGAHGGSSTTLTLSDYSNFTSSADPNTTYISGVIDTINTNVITIDGINDAIYDVIVNSGVTLTTAERNDISDAILVRNMSNVEDTAPEYSLATLTMAGLSSVASGTTRYIYKTDRTLMHSQTLYTSATAEPITGVN